MKERIKMIRKELHLTQKAFTERLGVSRSNLAGYESGTRIPSDAAISLICSKFNVNEHWLRTGEGKMFLESKSFSLDTFVKQHNGSEIEFEILKAYFEIDPKIRQEIIKHFRSYFAHNTSSLNKSDVPDTPEELEKQFSPLEDETQTG